MAWNTRTTWTAGQAVNPADLNGISNDIRTWGDNVNANGMNLANLGLIAQPAWTAPTLLNAWVNYGGFQVAQYRKDVFGRVWIRGFIKSGTITNGTVLFTLPSGYWPLSQQVLPISVNNNAGGADVLCHLIVDTAGGVALWSASTNGWLTFGNISFSTD